MKTTGMKSGNNSPSGCEIQKKIDEIGYDNIVLLSNNDELLKRYSDDEIIDQIVNNYDRDIETIIAALQASIN
jgi:hypothetical protein